MSSMPVCKRHDRSFWRIVHYKHNHSAFNSYHYTVSDYSDVMCIAPGCFESWRTKANYVRELPLLKLGEHHHYKSREGCL